MLLQQFTQIAVKAVEHRKQGNPLVGVSPSSWLRRRAI
jgi:hypothetical protein